MESRIWENDENGKRTTFYYEKGKNVWLIEVYYQWEKKKNWAIDYPNWGIDEIYKINGSKHLW